PNELENLEKKHADVLNPAVDHIVNWQEPMLGNGGPPPTEEEFQERFKKSLKIRMERGGKLRDKL
ncbi:MAG: hypothetical protein WAW11_00725, partial [Patescibacteria group bacterium]